MVRDPTAAGEGLRVSDLAIVRAQGGVRLAGGVGAVVAARVSTRRGGEVKAHVLPATPGAAPARGLTLVRGRDLREDDPPDACVLEAELAARLGQPAIGELVSLSLSAGDAVTRLRVVGVCAKRSDAARRTDELGFDTAHPMYHAMAMPMLQAMGIPTDEAPWKRDDLCLLRRLPPGEAWPLDWIYLRVQDPHQVSPLAEVLRTHEAFASRPVLCRRALVAVALLDPRMDRYQSVLWALFVACLVMGAVVIANLGLLTAMSRQHEIALRRVEGATRGDVAKHVLVEGVLVALVGIVLGCALAAGLAELRVRLEATAGFTWAFPWARAALGGGIALVVAVLASWIPARASARQHPASALEAA